MDKQQAHEPPGHLHEAFSVVVLDAEGRVLLQRRATTKYHFPGLWTNACCSHPTPGGDLVAEAQQRTREELGLDVALRVVGSFTYRAEDVLTGLVEHEHDTVLVGSIAVAGDATGAGVPFDPTEVEEVRWVSPADLTAELSLRPEAFTPWCAQVLDLALGA
jgi:isopentenyl-diphosphate delta-isomerase